MYVLAPNQVIEKFPYSIGDLRKDNPQTSFPANPSPATLAEFNVFTVVSTNPEYDQKTHVGTKTGCAYNSEAQQWETTWSIREKTAEELQAETNAQAASVRSERNALISASDWTQLDDTPITNSKKLEWAAYRQALRDIPAQAGFPWDVTWPTKP